MPRYRVVLEYDGSDFSGWQAQTSGARTVQQTLESALATLAGERVAVTGAGRTDAGVHAEGQVASFVLPTARLVPGEIVRALNANLPGDLVVLQADAVPDAFDPRRDARAKCYRYDVWNAPVRSPLRARRWLHVPGPLDREAMARAATAFEGDHDFRSLQSTGSSVQTSRRTVLHCGFRLDGPEVRLHVEGTGFLRHMVRAMAGTLIEIGQGRRPADGIPALLAARDRAAAGPNAPAHGLTLVAVRYDPPGESEPPEVPS